MFGTFKWGLVQLSFHEEPCEAAFIPQCPIISRLIVLSANGFFSSCDNPVVSLNNCGNVRDVCWFAATHTPSHSGWEIAPTLTVIGHKLQWAYQL